MPGSQIISVGGIEIPNKIHNIIFSYITSIAGTPFGAGGMPVRSKLPSLWLSRVITRSPSYTWSRYNHNQPTLGSTNLDSNHTLVVLAGGEGLGLLGRDGRVPLDQAAHDGALSLNSEAERRNIEQNKICDF